MLEGQSARHLLEQGEYLPEEEEHLKGWVARGEKARDVLVLAHLRLVLSIASGLYSVARGVDYWDLVQEISLALLEALERYDPERGGFTPFVRPRLEGAARDALRCLVYEAEGQQTVSLEDFGDNYPWDEYLAQREAPATEDGTEQQEGRGITRQVVSWLLKTRLTHLQQYVLIHSFGLFDHPRLTEEEMAQIWPEGECTFQNVGQVKTAAVERLQENTPAIARLLADAALGEVQLFDFEQLELGI